MTLLFLQHWFSEEVLKATGWTLIHSLWQGVLAAIVAGAIIIATKRSAARVRYNLLVAVLVLFVMSAFVTFALQLKGRNIVVNNIAVSDLSTSDVTFTVSDQKITSTTAPTTLHKFVEYFNKNADLFVLMWAFFFLVHCAKLAGGLAGIRRLKNHKSHAVTNDWLARLNVLSQQLGIARPVKLLQSELVKVPVAVGIIKPVILVPLGLLSNLPVEQVETILLHELAHIRRHDYLVNILQRLAEAIFFFNPALLWISAQLRQEREACCDDIVVASTDHKRNYLEALISFQEYSLTNHGCAMAISSKKFYLLNRVKRMITLENKKLNVMEKIALLAGLIGFTAFTFLPKKEAHDIVPLSRSVSPSPEIRTMTPATAPVLAKSIKHVIHKENPIFKVTREPVLEVSTEIPPIDTVPDKGKKKGNYDELRFPSISSSVNDDGKTKTESVTVTDQAGKKYSYKKENDKITSLVVDGRTIPPSEYGNYSPLLDKIDQTMQENRARRMEQMQMRRAERDMRIRDQQNRVVVRQYQNAQRQYQNTQRQYLLQQNRQYQLIERSRRAATDQKREMIRLQNRLRQMQVKPMLNGREVIMNDRNIRMLDGRVVLVKANVNTLNRVALITKPINVITKTSLIEPTHLKVYPKTVQPKLVAPVKPLKKLVTT